MPGHGERGPCDVIVVAQSDAVDVTGHIVNEDVRPEVERGTFVSPVFPGVPAVR